MQGHGTTFGLWAYFFSVIHYRIAMGVWKFKAATLSDDLGDIHRAAIAVDDTVMKRLVTKMHAASWRSNPEI